MRRSEGAGANRGIRYGPIRAASRICAGVALSRAGANAPGTMPPRAAAWWQPEQLSMKSDSPCASDVPASDTRGIGGPPNDPMYASSAAISPGVYAGFVRVGSSAGDCSGIRPVLR